MAAVTALAAQCDRALQASQRSRAYGTLMVLDLDNFKVINDTRGHAAGDQLLMEVAQRIPVCPALANRPVPDRACGA